MKNIYKENPDYSIVLLTYLELCPPNLFNVEMTKNIINFLFNQSQIYLNDIIYAKILIALTQFKESISLIRFFVNDLSIFNEHIIGNNIVFPLPNGSGVSVKELFSILKYECQPEPLIEMIKYEKCLASFLPEYLSDDHLILLVKENININYLYDKKLIVFGRKTNISGLLYLYEYNAIVDDILINMSEYIHNDILKVIKLYL